MHLKFRLSNVDSLFVLEDWLGLAASQSREDWLGLTASPDFREGGFKSKPWFATLTTSFIFLGSLKQAWFA